MRPGEAEDDDKRSKEVGVDGRRRRALEDRETDYLTIKKSIRTLHVPFAIICRIQRSLHGSSCYWA